MAALEIGVGCVDVGDEAARAVLPTVAATGVAVPVGAGLMPSEALADTEAGSVGDLILNRLLCRLHLEPPRRPQWPFRQQRLRRITRIRRRLRLWGTG